MTDFGRFLCAVVLQLPYVRGDLLHEAKIKRLVSRGMTKELAEKHLQVVLLDCWPVNLSEETRQHVMSKCPGMELMFIPAGGTGRYQVNDTDLHKPLKDTIRYEAYSWYRAMLTRLKSLNSKADEDPEKLTHDNFIIACNRLMSMGTLRDKAPQWANAALKTLTKPVQREDLATSGFNIIKYAWYRIYMKFVDSTAFQNEALARIAVREAAKLAADAAAVNAAAATTTTAEAVDAATYVPGAVTTIPPVLVHATTAHAVSVLLVSDLPMTVSDATTTTDLVERLASIERRLHLQEMPSHRNTVAKLGVPKKRRESRIDARTLKFSRTAEITDAAENQIAVDSTAVTTAVTAGRSIRKCSNLWCRQPGHTKTQCTTVRPVTAADSVVIDAILRNNEENNSDDDQNNSDDDHGSEGEDESLAYNSDAQFSDTAEEDDNDMMAMNGENGAMQLTDEHSSSAVATYLPSSLLQIQRPQLVVETFVLLNTVVAATDPDYLSFVPGRLLQVYGQIIATHSRKFLVRWLTGNLQPEPEIEYSAARLHSLLRTEVSEDHGLIG